MDKILFGNIPIWILVLFCKQIIQFRLFARQHCRIIIRQQFTFIPSTPHLLVIFIHNSIAMLLAIFPMADLFLAILPKKFAEAMFLVILVITFVYSAIWPCENPLPVYSVMFPRSFKHSAIYPTVLSVAVDIIFSKVACIWTTICPLEFPFAVL